MPSSASAYLRSRLEPHYSRSELACLSRTLCIDVLGWSQVEYYADKDKVFSRSELQTVDPIIERLCRYEPIEYILGYTTFLGHRIDVSPAVLIPRPETEELVELMLADLPAQGRFFDLCSGSGCIAIALKLHRPSSQVTALELSPEAIAVGRHNAGSLGAEIRFIEADVLTYEPGADDVYDCIVSNPPYVCLSERADMQPNVLNYEPHMALFVPDEAPLLFYHAIARIGRQALRPGGKLYLEVNRAYGRDVLRMLDEAGYADAELKRDLSGNERFIIATK